jgi:hypothetical protein
MKNLPYENTEQIVDAVQYEIDAKKYDEEVTSRENQARDEKLEKWKREKQDFLRMEKKVFIENYGDSEHARVTDMFSRLGGGRRTCRRKRYRSRTKKRKQKKTKKRR